VRVVDAIARILRVEGVGILSCCPTTPMIDAATDVGIRPILCHGTWCSTPQGTDGAANDRFEQCRTCHMQYGGQELRMPTPDWPAHSHARACRVR
jgi:hypothetical protein